MSRHMAGLPPRQPHQGTARDWTKDLAPLGPRRLKVVWDISNKCNLRCRMCHFSFHEVFQRPADYMTPAAFERLAEQVLPHAHTLILSAANEPLTSPWFVEILQIAARFAVPDLLFITNGTRLTPRIAEAATASGVTQVQISIDGSTKSTYEHIRRGAKFEQLVENIAYLTRLKQQTGSDTPRLQFNIVLMKSNVEELDGFVDLAERLGVEWLAARHLLMMNGLGMEAETLFDIPERANDRFRQFLHRAEISPSVKIVSFPNLFEAEERESIAAPPERTGEIVAPPRTIESASDPTLPLSLPIWAAARLRARAASLGQHLRARRAAPSIGYIDSPAPGAVAADNALDMAGWALDKGGIACITIERRPWRGDRLSDLNERGLVPLGTAKIVSGARPDVSRAFPDYPDIHRAGWVFELRRERLSSHESFQTSMHVFAHARTGRVTPLGHRDITFAPSRTAAPYLFCGRPFDSVLIEPSGAVKPYPDCDVQQPFGSLLDPGSSFASIWYGSAFTELRQQIIDRQPPTMCLACPHFINRNVDDSSYFQTR